MRTSEQVARRLAVVFLATIATMATACDDPTSPAEVRVRIDASSVELAAAHVAVADISSRLTPSIMHLSGVAELEAAVAALVAAVERVDAADVERQVRRASDLMTKIRASGTEAEAADIDAIDLAFDEATRLLTYPASADNHSNLRTP